MKAEMTRVFTLRARKTRLTRKANALGHMFRRDYPWMHWHKVDHTGFLYSSCTRCDGELWINHPEKPDGGSAVGHPCPYYEAIPKPRECGLVPKPK